MPKPIVYYIFGAKNKTLLKSILDDANLYFKKWAANQISRWNNITKIKNCYKIGGSNDKLIPQEKSKNMTLVKNSTHFMMVDKSNDIGLWLNNRFKSEID